MSFIKIEEQNKHLFCGDYNGCTVMPIKTQEGFYILNADILDNNYFEAIHEDLKKLEIIETFTPIFIDETPMNIFQRFGGWVSGLFTRS